QTRRAGSDRAFGARNRELGRGPRAYRDAPLVGGLLGREENRRRSGSIRREPPPSEGGKRVRRGFSRSGYQHRRFGGGGRNRRDGDRSRSRGRPARPAAEAPGEWTRRPVAGSES